MSERFNGPYRVSVAKFIPPDIQQRERDVIYVATLEDHLNPEGAYFAQYQCPCGCGHEAGVTLPRHPRAKWTLSVENGLPTFNPSIWSNKEGMCGAHYFIRAGMVEWA